MLEKVTPEQLSAAAINVADQMVRENGRLRQALQKSLTAMTLASCFDAVTAEYDFSHAIAEARAALSRPERAEPVPAPAQAALDPIELAAWLCALEDAECYKPIPESLITHGRLYIRAGMTEKHCGDCTNQSHSCVVCGADGYLLHARQIIEALSWTKE